MADVTQQMISQGDLWIGMFVHPDYCRDTTGRLPFESGPEQMSSLMELWIVVCSDQGDSTGRELDDLDVVRELDDSGQNARKIRDLITLGSSDVDELATEIFSCAYVACRCVGWFSPQLQNGALTTGQKYDAEYDVADDSTDLGPMLFRQTPCIVTKFRVQRKMAEVNCLSLGAFSSDLSKGAAEYSDSDFGSILVKPLRTRSNTTSARDLDKIVFQDVILPSACPACPRNLTTSPDKRQIRSVQQSLGKILWASRTILRRTTTCLKRSTRQST